MKNVKNLLIPIFMIMFVVLMIISIFIISPIINNNKKLSMRKKMFSDVENNTIFFNDVLTEISNYKYIHFEEDNSIIKVMYYDENGQKQKMKITNNNEFKKIISIFEKNQITEIIKIDNNVIFRYKKVSNSLQSIIYLDDKKSLNDSGYNTDNLKKIMNKWYYHEQ